MPAVVATSVMSLKTAQNLQDCVTALTPALWILRGGILKEVERSIFAAGCFWGVEMAFRQLNGVVNTTVGYIGGWSEKPTYKEVCTDTTGHAEAVRVEYNPQIISYEDLLRVFWSVHDPTTRNRQGPDVGSQYRSAIFYDNELQREKAMASKEALEHSGQYRQAIVTEILPATSFYPAEEYHQQYLEKRGLGSCHL